MIFYFNQKKKYKMSSFKSQFTPCAVCDRKTRKTNQASDRVEICENCCINIMEGNNVCPGCFLKYSDKGIECPCDPDCKNIDYSKRTFLTLKQVREMCGNGKGKKTAKKQHAWPFGRGTFVD